MGSPGRPESHLSASALREALDWARVHLRSVGAAWDETLSLVNGTDFQALSSREDLRKLRRAVRRWHDLTLEPVVRLAPVAERWGSMPPSEDGEPYLARVLVGMDLNEFNGMCDGMDAELESALHAGLPLARLDWRDRLVELMEIGVRTCAATIEWAEGTVRAAGAAA